MVDDLFVQRLKEEEMHHAEVDATSYELLRQVFRKELLPLYEQYRNDTGRIRERRLHRKVWQYILGSVAVCELIEAFATKGRSIAPGVLIPSAIFYSFIGFIIYAAAQYIDELHIRRARRNLDKAIDLLEAKAQTDATYDARRQLMDEDVLRSEALEILTHYAEPEAFWRDYRRVREADPTGPGELKQLPTRPSRNFYSSMLMGTFLTPPGSSVSTDFLSKRTKYC